MWRASRLFGRGGLILSGWARPAGEGVWEAAIPKEEVDLLASPVGIFPFLLRHPWGPGAWGPGAGRRKIRGVLLAPVPGWDDGIFVVPPILRGGFLRPPRAFLPGDLAQMILDLSATGGGSRVLAQLREAPSRLARGEIPRWGFGSPQANLAAWGGRVARLPGGTEGLLLALLRLRGEDPVVWARASAALAPFLGGGA